MEREQFVPTELRVKASTPFVLVLTNKDDITHELDIRKLRIEKKVRAGQTLKLQLPALKPGTRLTSSEGLRVACRFRTQDTSRGDVSWHTR